MKRVLGAALFVSIGGYLALMTLLVVFQRAIIFPAPDYATERLNREAAHLGTDVLSLTAADGTKLYAWHTKASGERAVLYFHGNASSVVQPDRQRQLTALGWDVLAVSYRGYSGSEGFPSEDGLRQDAHALWHYATVTLGIPKEHIVLHGLSLGGGVAAMLAEDVGPAGLVLESTFTSVANVAGDRWWMFPTQWLTRDHFATEGRAISCPILVVHGNGDPVIGVHHGRRLGEVFSQSVYVEVDVPSHGGLTVMEPISTSAYEAFLAQFYRNNSQ